MLGGPAFDNDHSTLSDLAASRPFEDSTLPDRRANKVSISPWPQSNSEIDGVNRLAGTPQAIAFIRPVADEVQSQSCSFAVLPSSLAPCVGVFDELATRRHHIGLAQLIIQGVP
jgi:hypothetical protein